MTATAVPTDLRVNGNRLMQRLMALADIGAIDGGGCARLALTDDDRAGRDLVVSWMRELGLEVTVDVVGNVVGVWNVGAGAAVMTGSHIDTVRTGGKYDGNLGVLAGLEIIETLQEAGLRPPRPVAVAFFTNEEGARYAPDMMGSLAYVGAIPVEEVLDTVGIDGSRVGEELARIGYSGSVPCPGAAPHAFVELHIEQGPVLEQEGVTIGAVTGVQGISWQEVVVEGQSNHAGTTPMSMRHDPAYVAADLAVFLRDLARRFGGHQVCTVGRVELHPNLINVVPARATLTLDVRNTDSDVLRRAEDEISARIGELRRSEGVSITTRRLARFEPVVFDEGVVRLVEETARSHGLSCMRLPSGAGHDAQMMARVCPTAMVFVPSHRGISHNPAEHTDADQIEAGCNVLLHVMLGLTGVPTTGSGTSEGTGPA
ncbi:MAG: M20 family metallo-hydrolase [Ilumatobacteraceae bacterium]